MNILSDTTHHALNAIKEVETKFVTTERLDGRNFISVQNLPLWHTEPTIDETVSKV